MDIRSYIRDIPDYPKPGITFFDITPMLKSPQCFTYIIDQMAERMGGRGATKLVCADARGFIFGAPLAMKLGIGLVPIRKPGKLPYKTVEMSYDLEYGSDTLCMHVDAVDPGEKVLVVDDLLATGGTCGAMIDLVKKQGGDIAGIGFVIELGFLNGASQLRGLPYEYLIKL
jgi:adenine phosphoribosyltransferase